MSFTVVYDANVLYPAALRDLLMRLALTGLFRARWSKEILDEWVRSLLTNRPDLSAERLERTRQKMNDAVADAAVTGHSLLAEGLALPDKNDRHVLAAAIKCGAQLIVTFNLKDFPPTVLGPLGITAEHPDDFVEHLVDLSPMQVASAIEDQARACSRPAKTTHDVLAELQARGLTKSVARLKEFLLT